MTNDWVTSYLVTRRISVFDDTTELRVDWRTWWIQRNDERDASATGVCRCSRHLQHVPVQAKLTVRYAKVVTSWVCPWTLMEAPPQTSVTHLYRQFLDVPRRIERYTEVISFRPELWHMLRGLLHTTFVLWHPQSVQWTVELKDR